MGTPERAIAVDGWHVEQNDTGVAVHSVDPAGKVDGKRLAYDPRAALRGAGGDAEASIGVERISQLAHTRLGKAPLIVGLPMPRTKG